MNSVKKIQIETQKQKAIKLIREGKHEQAFPILNSLINTKKTRDDVQVLTAFAHCHSAFGYPNEALFYLDVALSIDENYLHAQFLKGCVLGDIGKYQEGIVLVKGAIKDGLDDFEMYANLGALYQDSGEFNSAIDAYEEALSFSTIVDPEVIENRLANCYSELDQFSEAIKIYDKLISNNCRDTFTLYNKAVASEKMGKSSESLRLLNQVTEIDPYLSKAWIELADLYDAIDAKDRADECRARVEEIKSKK